MAVLVIIQARMGSTRLPGKVLMPLSGKPVLWHVINRIREAQHVDEIIIATTTRIEDNAIATLCREWGVLCFRGDHLDVLKRFSDAVKSVSEKHQVFDYIVRITADCPLLDPEIIDTIVLEAVNGGYDYVSNTDPPTYPDGLDVEVFTKKILDTANQIAVLKSDREHVTPYIRRILAKKKLNLKCDEDLSEMRWTLDTPEDYTFIKSVYDNLSGEAASFHVKNILALLKKKPELLLVNNMFQRNEGYQKSLLEDK